MPYVSNSLFSNQPLYAEQLPRRERNNTENETEQGRNTSCTTNVLTSNNKEPKGMFPGLKKSESQILLGKFSSLINTTAAS